MKDYRHMMVIGTMMAAAVTAGADMVKLEGIDSGTVTTGDLIDGVSSVPLTVSVAEISGLQLTAWSGGSDQVVNTTATSLGINKAAISDDTDALEAGEILLFSFSQPIRINQIDFNGFEDGESFSVSVDGGSALDITYAALANKSSDIYDLSLEIGADTEIALAAGMGSVIGLDGMDIEVIPEPATTGLLLVGGVSLLLIRKKRF
jgi:hypothetical protein